MLGIEIDSNYIRIINRARRKADQWLIEPIPYGLVQNGMVVSQEALALFIRKTLKKAGIQAGKCAICLSLEQIIVRELHLPVMEKESLEENIRIEIAEYLPLDLDEYVIDYRIINDKNSSKQNILRVMAVAVLKKIIDGYIMALKEAGLRPVLMDVPANCQERWFNEYIDGLQDLAFKRGNVCLIYIGECCTRFTLLQEGVYFIDKVSAGLGTHNGKIDMDFLIEEIADVLRYFYSRKTGHEVDNILVVGEKAIDYEMSEQLQQHLGIPVSLANMSMDDHRVRLVNAIGAAVEQSGTVDKGVNLIEARKSKRNNYYMLFAAVVAILIVLGIGIWGFWIPVRHKNELTRKIESLEIEKEQYINVQSYCQEIKSEIEELKEKERVLDQIISHSTQLSYLLTAIDECLASDVKIIEISADQDTIKLLGKAKDDSDIAQLLIALTGIEEFEKVFIEKVETEQTTGAKLFFLHCNIKNYDNLDQELHAEGGRL